MYGIVYKITDLTNNMGYFGQTTRSLKKRWREHCKPNNHCKYLSRVIKKHHKENFKIEIIERCYSQEQLNGREKHYIKTEDTKAPNGYNLTNGGEGNSGYKVSEKTIKKLSKAQKKYLKNHQNPFYGKKHSKETKELMSKKKKGKSSPKKGKTYKEIYGNRAKKIKNKMSKSQKNNTNGSGNKGKKHSKEYNKMMSKMMSGKNNPFYSHKHSKKAKRKNSESKKEYWRLKKLNQKNNRIVEGE